MFYIVKEPTDDSSWNYYLLYKLSQVKSRIIGMFYIPDLRYYGPVLDLDEHDLEKIRDIAVPLHEDYLLRSYLIVCRRCGWCCEASSGAFLFDNELEYVRMLYPERAARVRRASWVKLHDGSRVRIWHLDDGPRGMCIFYDPRTRSCTIHSVKPVVCMLTYCARYAVDRYLNKYVRVGKADKLNRVRFCRWNW